MTTLPRVDHLLPCDLARGSQVHARSLCDLLDGRGAQHRIVTLFDGPDHVLDPKVALDVPSGSWRDRGLDPRAALALGRYLRADPPALVVAHGGEVLKYLAVATPRHLPIVYYAIGVVPHSVHSGWERWLYRWLCRRPVLVAGVSSEVTEECVELLGVARQRAVVAPNGRDPDQFRPTGVASSAPPTVGFVGHLTSEKRPLDALAVIGRLQAQGRRVRAVVIGDGPLRHEVTAAAAAVGAETLGVRADVADLLPGFDVLLFPSERRGEGMPGILIEAGLCGVPVVATDVPGAADVIVDGQTGLVVPEGDVAAMTAAVGALLDDDHRRRRYGAAARARCLEGFTLEASAEHWRGIVERTLTEHPGGRGKRSGASQRRAQQAGPRRQHSEDRDAGRHHPESAQGR